MVVAPMGHVMKFYPQIPRGSVSACNSAINTDLYNACQLSRLTAN